MRTSKSNISTTWEGEGFTLEYTYQDGVYSLRVSKPDGEYTYSTPHAFEVMPAFTEMLGYDPGWFPDIDIRRVLKYQNTTDTGDDNVEFFTHNGSEITFRGSTYAIKEEIVADRVVLRRNNRWATNVFLFPGTGVVAH